MTDKEVKKAAGNINLFGDTRTQATDVALGDPEMKTAGRYRGDTLVRNTAATDIIATGANHTGGVYPGIVTGVTGDDDARLTTAGAVLGDYWDYAAYDREKGEEQAEERGGDMTSRMIDEDLRED
ncbi:MAG: hypothetical protein H0Z39_06165 [Peptococcaceae bacterium]|nr:hypothetical protein [Peptococcaceae bacterium]